MFNPILICLCCIFLLVRCNPLQQFPTSPIQYRENYSNEQRIQPSYFESYPQLYMTQNPLSSYQNVPISLNDIIQGVYYNNILQNEINSAVNINNCEQCGPKFRRYALNPTDLFIPNVVNNYFVVSPDNYQKNVTTNCNKRDPNEESTSNNNNGHKTKKKCKKRKRSESTNEKGDKNKRKCSRSKEINKENNGPSNHSNNQDVRNGRNNKCKDESQSMTDRNKNKMDNSIANAEQAFAKQLNCETLNQNIDKNSLQCTDITPPESGIKTKTKKNKSSNCQKVLRNDDCYDLSKLLDYFNDECTTCTSRCTRNYKEDKIQKYQPQYQIPSDFSRMAPYMMFNQQLFNADSYFPYNYDYLYNMQQFTSTPPPQKKPKNRRVNRRKKQKKSKKKNCDQNKQPANCDKVVELSPELIEGQTNFEPVTAQVEKPQIERSFNGVSTGNNGNIEESLRLNNEDFFSPVYDYYPEFHSDHIYTSKEDYDWDIFHDRNYYSSSDMSDLDRGRRNYDTTDDTNTIKYDKITKLSNNVKSTFGMKIENENDKSKKEIIMNEDDNSEIDDGKLIEPSEKVLFRTPPALDFPDFKTEMINKDNHDMKTEIIYQTNTKPANEYKSNKMSTYSNVKKVENEKRNTIVDQNDVETVSGHSKVVMYGKPPSKEDEMVVVENNNDENKNSNDGKTTIVIAKSLPYPIV